MGPVSESGNKLAMSVNIIYIFHIKERQTVKYVSYYHQPQTPMKFEISMVPLWPSKKELL